MPEKCPQCGAPLPAGALAGLCPACLLQQGAAPDTATGPDAGRFVTPTVEEVARLFPQLEVLGLLGKGGMGAVYKARQRQLDRIVALKILPPRPGSDSAFAERFTREAKALAKLLHPNIVTLFEFGQADGIYYLLMEYVDGVNLGQLLRSSRVSPREALAIVPQICDALQYAHDQGIVHRDIKPENILLDRRGRVKVADFGLAKLVEAKPPLTPALSPSDGERVTGKPGEGKRPVLTEEGDIMGTPKYMSPEQIEAPGEVDHRADIYALGVVFYQMLTGELPGKPLVPPSRAVGKVQIDVRLDEVVLRALERKPELRYQQASILKTQVETIATTPAAAAPAATAPWMYRGVDYRSEATLFGLPWVHVASGMDPATGRQRVAKGIIAIGGIAKGVVAIGGVAMGGLAFGGLAVGVFAYGGLALGLLALGGGAAALVAALGGGAIAPIALGGGAMGYFAYGGGALGVHVLDAMTKDPAAQRFFLPWAKALLEYSQLINVVLLVPVLVIGIGVPLWLQSRSAEPYASPDSGNGSTGLAAKPKDASLGRRFVLLTALVLLALILISVGAISLRIPSSSGRWGARYESSASAEFRYRVFEAEASLVDQLIPRARRSPGVMPSVKALARFDQPVSQQHHGDFKLTVQDGWTESQMVEISGETLQALVDGMTAEPGLLKDQRRVVASWPLVGDSWSASRASNSLLGSCNGEGFFGVQRKDGVLQARVEYSLFHSIHALNSRSERNVNALILFEGSAPTNGALAFLVPFLRQEGGPRYLVWVFEIAETPRFGPVIERVLPDPDDRRENETLSLRTGALASVLHGAKADGGGRIRSLVASEGDLYAEYDDYVGRRWALITHGLKLSDMTPSQWESASISDLNTALQTATVVDHVEPPEVVGATLYLLPDGLQPMTLAFQTREGVRGLMQITRFTDNPRGVKLRYKLVQAPEESPLQSASALAAPTAATTRTGFVARLPQGTIELAALSRHPSANQPWWRPDGTSWPNAGFGINTRHESETKGRRFEIVFQRRGLPKDTSLEYSFEPGALEASSGDQPQRQGKALPDHNMIVPLLPESARQVTIRLGVAAGEWRKVVSRTPQSGAGGAFTLGNQTCRALFLDPVELGGETRIAVSYNKVPGWTVRVAALDTSDKLHESFAYGESVDDTATAEGRFAGLRLSAVKEFRFEARPFSYVEFRNVSLEPGQRTQVEVVNAEGR